MQYQYNVEYEDSESSGKTTIIANYELTITDMEEILLEQLEANGIYVNWLKVIQCAPQY